MTSQKYFEEAWNNRKLVGGALKVAHVRPDYHLYEDLLILYADMLRKLDGQKPRTEIDKLSFKKVLWQTIDALRSEQRVCEHNTAIDEAYNLGEAAAWNNLVALKNEAKKLSQLEQVILFEHLLEKKTITQLVEECGVPRITLKRLKKQLLQKLRNVMEK
ncbi:sigma-70 family RNA polymerase sigma factor [Lactobacillus crispatus]|uniref:sigma-70 family RNA polymerase sigma factor n=1 Tax=Lactobacillus crispatus TaxID=47770 RepID=UPI00195BFAE8|nr:sigma-70 family RNA polymerase sigma factor [Lactobacillus crispatus]MBM6873911.1 sigma-70 family RNA polymerase sigma factor [Lactobacillus crispatus]